MVRSLFFILLGIIALFSCEREEVPVEPHDRGGVETVQIPLGSDYNSQVWYDLGTNSVIKVADKTSWELGFSCADSSWKITLNSSMAMTAGLVENKTFDEVNSIDEPELFADHPSGNPDSLALANWDSKEGVWIVDLGVDAMGNMRGKRKVSLSKTDDRYTIKYAKLDGSDRQTVTIDKDNRYNRKLLSLKTGDIVLPPQSSQYDLLFTQYTHIFYEPEYMPYLVTGTLINENNTSVAIDTTSSFSEINREMVNVYEFSSRLDAIGYDWKFYNFEASSYIIYDWMNFIVQDAEGYYYKLHFIDFYNDKGERGFPLMEVQGL
ncbi:HmuY family protein [Salibacter halophilus]|uniref:HmuY family protein n=1 Tax=Salibacter halophilus TaxID=1803916 RepID=A0A6N6M5E5_9FLAO|nr:HmuY family protein [Salibacter halophilus]KAB1062015.1 hypothetical protein F3059_13135 [Salibacter halophilus]